MAAEERMTPTFAVFNNHVNKARIRADREFIDQFGQEAYDAYILPLHEAGIMTIFDTPPATGTAAYTGAIHFRAAWVALCTAYVNEPDVIGSLRVRISLRLEDLAHAAFDPADTLDSDGTDQATRNGIMQAREAVLDELRKAKRRIPTPRGVRKAAPRG